ncbi:MAG: hypothetical protein ABSD73_00510 [Candidatus Bathyarchaeia archaeon]|jgi:hypothetical protein
MLNSEEHETKNKAEEMPPKRTSQKKPRKRRARKKSSKGGFWDEVEKFLGIKQTRKKRAR